MSKIFMDICYFLFLFCFKWLRMYLLLFINDNFILSSNSNQTNFGLKPII